VEIRKFRDNELITGITILAVIRDTKKLEFSKCMLIEPLLSYSKVLRALKRVNSSIKSVEDLVLKEEIAFSNFNSRFQDNLLLTINSILLFEQMGLLKIENGFANYRGGNFDFSNQSLGKKAADRIKAAKKLAEILAKGDASDLYLSLRIEL